MIRALSHKTPLSLRGIPSVVTHKLAGMRGWDLQLDCFGVSDSWMSFEVHEFPGPWLSSSLRPILVIRNSSESGHPVCAHRIVVHSSVSMTKKIHLNKVMTYSDGSLRHLPSTYC